MNRLIALYALPVLLLAGCQADREPQKTGLSETEMMQHAADSRAITQEFGKTLKGELQAAIKAGGPVAAIAVCHSKAPAIAQALSQKTGWDIHRTSLKPRRTAPDAWEKEVLLQFDTRQAAGEDPKKIEYYAVVEQAGKPVFRYMKALGTAPLCLNCHGRDIKPEVQAKLHALYPDDQATGYEAGQIRGAFSIVQPL